MNNTANLLQTQESTTNRWLIITTIMLLAILEVLDSTIVNVALPAMMPSLGANQNQITWVLTSYVVAAAIVLPLTGYLSNQLGQKRLLLICSSGFMISSFFCGISDSLTQIVFFRIMQGACGASLIPLSQAILRKTFPLEEQGKAMAIWGLGIMAAPVFGPTLGGFITEHSSWRWVFYINLPICLIGFIATLAYIPDTKKIKQNLDVWGLILMVVGIATLQIFLDKGNTYGWFTSPFILSLAVIAAFSLCYFIIYSLCQKKPLINLRLYRYRNLTVCSILMMLFCATLFGLITLEPILLESSFGYTALLAGWTMAGSGVASAVGMGLCASLLNRIKVKWILTTGLLFCFTSAYLFSNISLQTMEHQFVIYNAFMGFGMGLFMVPLATYALADMNKNYMNEASGLFSYARMLGTSLGISLLVTLATNLTQITWHDLGAHITQFNPALHHWLFLQGATSLHGKSVGLLAHIMHNQATLIAFTKTFRVIALVFLFMIPVTWLVKNVELKS